MMNDLQVLAARQIDKHGRDRYPTVVRQAMKLTAEVGELNDALLKDPLLKTNRNAIKSELADVALCVAELANKLHLDLADIVRELVENDDRTFALPGRVGPED